MTCTSQPQFKLVGSAVQELRAAGWCHVWPWGLDPSLGAAPALSHQLWLAVPSSSWAEEEEDGLATLS